MHVYCTGVKEHFQKIWDQTDGLIPDYDFIREYK